MKTDNKDTALRRAIGIVEEERQVKLPSNFAYITMKRIEAEKRRKTRRYRIFSVVSTTAVSIAGIVVVAVLYGKEIALGFVDAFANRASFSGLIPMLICLIFFATLNSILQKHFHTD